MLTVIATLYGVGSLFWGTATFLGARKDNAVTNGATIGAAIGSGVFMAIFWPLLLLVAAIGILSLARGK